MPHSISMENKYANHGILKGDQMSLADICKCFLTTPCPFLKRKTLYKNALGGKSILKKYTASCLVG